MDMKLKLEKTSNKRSVLSGSKPSRFKRWGYTALIIIVNLAAMVGLFLLLTLYVFPDWLVKKTDHGVFVVVPDVRGMESESASLQLSENNLKPMVIKTIFKDGCKPGEVIEQLPEADMKVKPGRNVYLTINSFDVQKFVFPNVIQMSSRQARAFLEDSRFIIDEIIYEPYEDNDLVLSVTVPGSDKEFVAGEKYPKHTHVVLHVSNADLEEIPENGETEETFYE